MLTDLVHNMMVLAYYNPWRYNSSYLRPDSIQHYRSTRHWCIYAGIHCLAFHIVMFPYILNTKKIHDYNIHEKIG